MRSKQNLLPKALAVFSRGQKCLDHFLSAPSGGLSRINFCWDTPPFESRQIIIQLRADAVKPGTTFTQRAATSFFGRTASICSRTEAILAGAESIFSGTTAIFGGAASIYGRTEAILAGAESIFSSTTSIFLSEIETWRRFDSPNLAKTAGCAGLSLVFQRGLHKCSKIPYQQPASDARIRAIKGDFGRQPRSTLPASS